jgi:predicted DNA-binding transcriptional regulator YafY
MTEQVRRASRLVAIEHRLRQNPRGHTVRELAEALGYSMRTIQRDINVLESELGVPLTETYGRRYRLMQGSSPIGAIRFTVHEARAMYLAIRLFLRHADERDPDGLGALEKLANALPLVLSEHAKAAAEELKLRPPDRLQTAVVRSLTEAWVNSERVRIVYRSHQSRAEKSTLLDPYLLEPSATGAATYVFGHSSEHGTLRTFKVDRILSVDPVGEQFQPPDLAELRTQIAHSWGGAVVGEDQVDVTLIFAGEAAERVREQTYHQSQRLTDLPDGALRFEVRLPSLLEFTPWVRSWGPAVRVIEPPELVSEIAADARATAALYAT